MEDQVVAVSVPIVIEADPSAAVAANGSQPHVGDDLRRPGEWRRDWTRLFLTPVFQVPLVWLSVPCARSRFRPGPSIRNRETFRRMCPRRSGSWEPMQSGPWPDEEALAGPLDVHAGDRHVDGRLAARVDIGIDHTGRRPAGGGPEERPREPDGEPLQRHVAGPISIASAQMLGVGSTAAARRRASHWPRGGADGDGMIQDKLLIQVIRAAGQVDRSVGVGVGQEEIRVESPGDSVIVVPCDIAGPSAPDHRGHRETGQPAGHTRAEIEPSTSGSRRLAVQGGKSNVRGGTGLVDRHGPA